MDGSCEGEEEESMPTPILTRSRRQATKAPLHPQVPPPPPLTPAPKPEAQVTSSARVEQVVVVDANPTFIRLQIKSRVLGVIEGNETIPIRVDVMKTWLELFQEHRIGYNPKHHVLQFYGQILEKLSSPIAEMYRKYKVSRGTYQATIKPKPVPKVTPPKKKKPSKPRPKKRVRFADEVEEGNGRGLRTATTTKASVKSYAHPSPQPRPPTSAALGVAPPEDSSDADVDVVMIDNDNQQQHHQEEAHLPPPVVVAAMPTPPPPPRQNTAPQNFQPPSGFLIPTSNGNGAGTSGPSSRKEGGTGSSASGGVNTGNANNNAIPRAPRFINIMPENAYRDESTMGGDVLRGDETELKPKVIRYFQEHCSNRDLLTVQGELRGLKRAAKYQALNRLLPFTAGILQNALLDE